MWLEPTTPVLQAYIHLTNVSIGTGILKRTIYGCISGIILTCCTYYRVIVLFFVCLCMSHYRVRFIEVAIVDVRYWGTHYIFRAGPNITCISNLRLSLGQMIYHMINVPFKEVHNDVVLTCTCLYISVLSGHKSPTCTQQTKDLTFKCVHVRHRKKDSITIY